MLKIKSLHCNAIFMDLKKEATLGCFSHIGLIIKH